MPPKIHPLARGWRAVFIVCGLGLAAMPLLPLLFGLRVTGTPLDFVLAVLFFGGLASLSLAYGLTCRLVTRTRVQITLLAYGCAVERGSKR